MLTPIETSKTQTVLGKPKDWNDETQGRCIGLPIHIDHYASGDCGVVSYWKPTLRDRIKLLFGGLVCLTVISGAPTQPPVCIEIANGKQ